MSSIKVTAIIPKKLPSGKVFPQVNSEVNKLENLTLNSPGNSGTSMFHSQTLEEADQTIGEMTEADENLLNRHNVF